MAFYKNKGQWVSGHWLLTKKDIWKSSDFALVENYIGRWCSYSFLGSKRKSNTDLYKPFFRWELRFERRILFGIIYVKMTLYAALDTSIARILLAIMSLASVQLVKQIIMIAEEHAHETLFVALTILSLRPTKTSSILFWRLHFGCLFFLMFMH